jgi:hypothetical protein
MRHRNGAPSRLGLCAVLGLGGVAVCWLYGWLGREGEYAHEFDFDVSYTDAPYLEHSRQVRTPMGFSLLVPDTPVMPGTPLMPDGTFGENARQFLERAVQACRRRAGGPHAECVMADVGAQLGHSALYMASLVGRNRIVAWECNADTLRFLQASLRVNPKLASKVTLLETAASDRSGPTMLSVSPIVSTLGDVDGSLVRLVPGRTFQMQVRRPAYNGSTSLLEYEFIQQTEINCSTHLGGLCKPASANAAATVNR